MASRMQAKPILLYSSLLAVIGRLFAAYVLGHRGGRRYPGRRDLLTAVAICVVNLACFWTPDNTPTVTGGSSERMQRILKRIPLLSWCPGAPLNLPAFVQTFLFVLQMQWEERVVESTYDFKREDFDVTLPGDSTTGHPDKVCVQWIQGLRSQGSAGRKRVAALPEDAPIVLLCAGLNCTCKSLPGTSVYKILLKQPWRVGVYEKRGMWSMGGKGLRSPVFHLFGHVSDLRIVVAALEERFPKAPLHLVGFSSGDGLAASFTAIHGHECKTLRSTLCLIGGDDYNKAFRPEPANWFTHFVIDIGLLGSVKNIVLKRNEAVLRKANPEAFEACLRADKLQDLYDIGMTHFSGYSDRAEAERRINPWANGNVEPLQHMSVPFLYVCTLDDPVAPGGPNKAWTDAFKTKPKNSAIAAYPTGCHLACYDSWRFTRWVEKLIVEWVDAVDAA